MANPLARAIMGKNLKDNNPVVRSEVLVEETNLNIKERQLISHIINGERAIVEGTIKNKPITLEEAVNRIKNNR